MGRIGTAVAVALAAVAAICLSWRSDLGFSTALTPGLAEQLANRFGSEARTRLGAWHKFVGSLRAPVPDREAPPTKREIEMLRRSRSST